jgi:hypothetical protein
MDRVPAAARKRALAVLVLTALAMMSAWELYVRTLDSNETTLKAAEVAADRMRKPAEGNARRVFVFGSSRAFRGISPTTVREQLGDVWDVRQIAVPMGNGPAQLHAGMDWFKAGDVAVVECTPLVAYTGLRLDAQSELEQRLQGAGAGRLEKELISVLRQHLAFSRGLYSPGEQLRKLARDTLNPGTPAAVEELPIKPTIIHPDGWQEYTGEFDPSLAIGPLEYLKKTAPADATQAFNGVLWRLRGDVRLLESRGVLVVFLRLPSEGAHAAAEEMLFPRARYWNRLQGEFPGRCWHFADFEATRDLATYDYTHLSSRSALAYSRWLGARLRGFTEEHSP